MILKNIAKFLELIKFSHTIFALPFALISVILAFNRDVQILQEKSKWELVAWIIVAMVGARSGAMGFNRLVDRKWAAENPRTAKRPSVTGEIKPLTMGHQKEPRNRNTSMYTYGDGKCIVLNR